MALSIPSPITYLISTPPTMLLMLALTIIVIILSSLFLSKKSIVDVSSATSKITISNSVQPLPPSPPKLPIIGNLHQLSFLPHRSLRSLSDQYGPLMLLQLGRLPTLVASSPSIIREITKTQDLIFSNRTTLKAHELFFHGLDIIFAPYGEYWREMKKASILHLLSNKKVAYYKQAMEEEVVFMMKEIKQTVVVDITEKFYALSREVICRAVISETTRNKWWGDELKSVLKESSKLIGEIYIGDFIPWMGKIDMILNGFEGRVKKTFEMSENLLEGIIKEHMKAVEKRKEEGGDRNAANECFLDVLLALEESKCKGSVLYGSSIKAIIKDMLGAGTYTTSISMEWTMAELLRHPTAMKKLKKEITKIVGPNKTIIKEEQLTEMSYLKAVIKEVLRLHPPGAILVPRQLAEDTSIKGYRIPKGIMVLINVWAIGRDPKVWDSPEEFRPERFINGEATNLNFKSHGFQLLAFGAGRRSCPGIQFSVTLIELVVANLVYAFDWKPTKGDVEDIDMSEDYGFFTRKREPLLLIAKKD